jgi:hypothetical protein
MGRDGCAVYSEHSDIEPVYCSGVASVMVDQGNLHFSFYSEHMAGDGSKERVIVARLVLSASAFASVRKAVDFEVAADLLLFPVATALAS